MPVMNATSSMIATAPENVGGIVMVLVFVVIIFMIFMLYKNFRHFVYGASIVGSLAIIALISKGVGNQAAEGNPFWAYFIFGSFLFIGVSIIVGKFALKHFKFVQNIDANFSNEEYQKVDIDLTNQNKKTRAYGK